MREEFQENAESLIKRLRDEGLNLLHLRSAINHWCSPPSTVIHAPKYVKHFKILLKVLNVKDSADQKKRKRPAALWRMAWNEVRRSRGEAIQAGVQAHEILTEELQDTLRKFLPEIKAAASEKPSFKITIPDNFELHGTVFFFCVVNIEEGFLIPETEFKIVRDLNEVNQWRE